MKISVVGCGYLGAVHAAAMARLGHEVVGIDTDRNKISELQNGRAPFFEPGLTELLSETQQTGRLVFSEDISEISDCAVHFLCVGTPQTRGENKADMTYVFDAFQNILEHAQPGSIIVGKSTVPVGTANDLATKIPVALDVQLLWNPEFLREGHAVRDTLTPDRLVYGVKDSGTGIRATAILDEVYQTILESDTPRLIMNYASAELVKTAANSFLATKISFINAMAQICDASGGDVTKLAEAIGLDDRIGPKFLTAGVGFGGGCLPKDIRAFMARAGELGAAEALMFLREVDKINMRQREYLVDKARALLGGTLLGQRITILGAAFKPNSDDVRDSPALSVAAQLELQGANVTVTDPQAISNARRRFPELNYQEDIELALNQAELVILLTEWEQFVSASPEHWGTLVAQRRLLDGRNALDIDKWRNAGWSIKAVGRPINSDLSEPQLIGQGWR